MITHRALRSTALMFLCIPILNAPETAALAQGAGPASQPAGPASAEAVVRRMADFYKRAHSILADVEQEQKIAGQSIKTTTSVAFERPNRFAARSKGAMPGFDIVSDGKTLSLSVVGMKKFTQVPAPASLEALQEDPIARAALQFSLVPDLCAADPYTKVMEGVKTVTDAGLEPVEGGKAHHLKFTQDQFDWEMWVAAEGDPVVQRVVLDLTRMLGNSPLAAQLKGKKFEMVQSFKGWRFDQGINEQTFAFQPPLGSLKVRSLTEGPGANAPEPPSPLLSKPAPDVTLKLLDEGEFRLKDHRKSVVMLDFWATWCGPCVMELPLLVEVASAYKDKGVVFCAVNQQETPDEIRKFLKDKKLSMKVALDTEGEVGKAYHADAIPLLVLIDKDGIVQSVHLGYNPSIKETLGKELDALLAGKSVASQRRDVSKEAPKTEGLELAWTASEPFAGVATDPQGKTIYALMRQGRCQVLDAAGKTIRTFQISARDHDQLRLARFAGDVQAVVSFQTWQGAFLVSRSDGTRLWEGPSGQGIDDVWTADLNNDGVDEVIVGYNGMTGLHVFAADGKRLWKREDLANVWHVTAGDLSGQGKPDVICTSASGQVHLSNAPDGKAGETLTAGLYANMVRMAPGRSGLPQRDALVLVVGRGASDQEMAALDGQGKRVWKLTLPADATHCDSLAVSPTGHLAAAGMRGGRVCVVDSVHGRIVGQVAGQGMTPRVAWAVPETAGSPLVLVATGGEINAFRIKPAAGSSETSRP